MSPPLRILAYKPRPEVQTIRMERLMTCEPLELEYLYTVLDGHQVTLLDGMTDHRNPVRVARKTNAQVVLVTSFITNIHSVLRLAKELKALPQPPLVFVGGPHAEVVPEHFFGEGVDGVFFANQLAAIVAVVGRVARGEPFSDVGGAAFRANGSFVRNVAQPLAPSQLPLPKRVLFEQDPDRYYYLYYRQCASIKTAFGCNEHCNFCFCTKMHGGHYGPRPLESVMDEIESIQARNIFVLDDNFLSSRNRVLKFSEMIRQRGLHERKEFVVYGVAHFIARHRDVMAELRRSGVTGVIVGFEAIQDGDLQSMNKSASQADNDATVEICQELDIELFALFIVFPHWTDDDFRRLAEYVRSRGITFATFATHTILPGTDLAAGTALTVRRSEPAERKWWRYDLLRLHERPTRMSPLRFYLWLLYLYMVPSLGAASRKKLLRRFGFFGFVKAAVASWLVGLEYLVKLFLWK